MGSDLRNQPTKTMESKERIFLKEKHPEENWNFKEGQIPDDKWKKIEGYMREYLKFAIGEISLTTTEIIQNAKDTCPEYTGEQKNQQCDGAYQTGYHFGALLMSDRMIKFLEI